MIRRSLIAASVAVAALAGTAALPVAAQPIVVQVAPPPPRIEHAPPPRRGQVWVPGYWEWRGNRHVWRSGYFIAARPGQIYRPPVWVERGGRWEFERRGWGRGDRDGDGVPNRVDRRPNDPYRR